MTFDDFELDHRAVKILHDKRITEPTPIQAAAIPFALEGRDVIGLAQTGTGKTLAYALPALTRLVQGRVARNMMLVLVPTRELCVQVHEVIEQLGAAMKIRSTLIYGGVGYDRQTSDLEEGVPIVVATPGRLLDHMSRGRVNFGALQILVLDEADRMLDMGFLPDIQRIVRRLPVDRQTLMFSATFPREIERLAESMMHNAERVSVGTVAKPVDTVTQEVYAVRQEDKTRLLTILLEDKKVDSALVFLRTRERTERLAASLKKKHFKIAQIHGNRSQSQRQQALDGFRAGKYNLLVATDVAARGLDIDGVSHVFNYDIPPTADDYIHRIGRTARAKAEGAAITFAAPSEHKALETIERALGHNIERVEWEDAPSLLSLYKPEAATPAARAARRRSGPGRRMLRRR
ncbi:MAG: DEAD/DEAH box helicase [Candidatus Hydrogenedentota bacterium]